jgi:hypothetical protein
VCSWLALHIAYASHTCTGLKGSSADLTRVADVWAEKVLEALGMQDRAPEGEAAFALLQRALVALKASRTLRPVFAIDVNASFSSAQLKELLLTCKELGADTSLAQFVVVVSAAHTAAGVLTSLRGMRVLPSARQPGGARGAAVHPRGAGGVAAGVFGHQPGEEQLTSEVITKCGTRMLSLRQLCRDEWGSCSTLADTIKAIDDFAAVEVRNAATGLAEFVAKVAKRQTTAVHHSHISCGSLAAAARRCQSRMPQRRLVFSRRASRAPTCSATHTPSPSTSAAARCVHPQCLHGRRCCGRLMHGRRRCGFGGGGCSPAALAMCPPVMTIALSSLAPPLPARASVEPVL